MLLACGHDEMIPRIGLVVGLRFPASMKVLDLQSRIVAGDAIGARGWRCRSSGLIGNGCRPKGAGRPVWEGSRQRKFTHIGAPQFGNGWGVSD